MRSELSPRERRLLDAMERRSTVKEAALDAGIEPGYANQINLRIRAKRKAALDLLRDLSSREKRSRLVAKVLMEGR